MKSKVSDIVASFLHAKNIKHVFAISGGASLHLIHSIAKQDNIDYVCCHHEQACCMAADAYSRVTNHVGVTVATSGPGATNLVTGICCSYYDSIPLIAITGQVSRFRMVKSSKVRQIGFQETPIVDICKPIVKYAVKLSDAKDILYELEKSYYLALEGRKGPVLIDIPDDLQREYVEIDECKIFVPQLRVKKSSIFCSKFEAIQEIISKSKRPVIIAGWGINLSNTQTFVLNLAEALGIPFVTTWAMKSLTCESHDLNIGTFGTHGQRHANFAVQNADLIISMGARLDTKATGTPINTFARDAYKIAIDIDMQELNKFEEFGLKIDLPICENLEDIANEFDLNIIKSVPGKHNDWIAKINEWKTDFQEFDQGKKVNYTGYIEPYRFLERMSGYIKPNTNILVDTGCSIAWVMQSMKISSGNKVFHDFNNTAMGWAIPASVGSYFASPDNHIVCITGDGSLMMTVHELAVISKHQIPVKIFLINNNGYAMIQQTQDQWLESNYYASSPDGGLGFPSYQDLAKAFGFKYYHVNDNTNIDKDLSDIFSDPSACFCDVFISPESRVIPQVKAGRPNEDMEPLLNREQFFSQMITKALDVSSNE